MARGISSQAVKFAFFQKQNCFLLRFEYVETCVCLVSRRLIDLLIKELMFYGTSALDFKCMFGFK